MLDYVILNMHSDSLISNNLHFALKQVHLLLNALGLLVTLFLITIIRVVMGIVVCLIVIKHLIKLNITNS